MLKHKIKRLAFTLAEVLIVLGIVGIVAEMTIPTVKSNIDKSVYVTKLKKVYSTLSSSIKLMMVQEGFHFISDSNLLTDIDGNTADLGTFFSTYFRVIKDCGFSSNTECLADSFKYVTGDPLDKGDIVSARFYCVIVSDGSTICLRPGNPTGVGPSPVFALVDVNALKGPNTLGRDIFNFDIFYDGSIDENTVNPARRMDGTASSIRQARAAGCLGGFNYGGCFGKILDDGWKMDY